ncbi:uncharacterized protein LOC132733602 isoform X1 [Ruditapes philippinarum]|uniref:uncharacterized protein LOC132733602 isoform X1 n=1 Tax=Ruditapes philippinarum TaxID=129788 RepID=UPI00295B8A0B|nr:uncharacterized protein LOC132733602 isoform X1 [Ruditapes philippinarum]
MAPVTSAIRMLYVAIFPVIWNRAIALDCYDCYSFNNSDPNCGDPFHPAYGDLKKDCQQGKEGFIGLYPAKFCIKLIGTTVNDDKEMVYRGCSLSSLDSQCGDFKFEDVRYRGCMMSCTENACNHSVGLRASVCMTSFLTMILLMTSLVQYYNVR